MRRLVIIGAGGHGKVAADIASRCGYRDIVFLDDNSLLKSCMGYPVVGRVSDSEEYKDSDFFVAVGNSSTREKIQSRLPDGSGRIATLIHPQAVVASNVEIEAGTIVMAGTVINPDSRIGAGCIINTGATVDHDADLEDYVHVSVGCHLAGTVHVGKGTWIGAGAVVSNNVNICGGCIIGAGAVVVRDLNEADTYIGVPAKRINNTNLL